MQIIMSMSIILIPTTLMGATLPLVMKTYSENHLTVGKDIGKLYSVNNVGAGIATLVAGFAMLPLLGVQNSIILTAMINVGMGTGILLAKRYFKLQYLLILIVFSVGMFLLIPSYDIQTLNLGIYAYLHPEYTMEEAALFLERGEILFYKESMYSSVLVTKFFGIEILKIDGKAQCTTNPSVVEGLERLASVPYEMFESNYGKPTTGLNIGLGCGITSNWLAERVKTTTIEIDPVVVESSKIFFEEIDHNLEIDDARNWLLRNEEKYDIITLQPSDPYENHGSMFTQEFFSILNSRLSENGLVSQWVPLYLLNLDDFYIFYNTFNEVFPYVYMFQLEKVETTQLVFVGSQKPLKINEDNFEIIPGEDIPASAADQLYTHG